MKRSLLQCLALVLCVLVCPAVPAWSQSSAGLALLSIEELMEIEVFTASRGDQQLAHTAAAAMVLTADDLRRAGVTSIPEALRLVPGMEVARINAGEWAVTARGFNDLFANKLLVLVDGRSVYTPLFSGVFWDLQALPMADIERIEVVRGPGAVLWGANAVNGIVNIITRSAAAAPLLRLTVGAGSQQRFVTGASAGGRLGESLHYRVHARASERNSLADVHGDDAHDGWRAYQGGFRVDGRLSHRDSLSLQGGIYDARTKKKWFLSFSPAEPEPREVMPATPSTQQHLQAQWTHERPGGSDIALQLAYARVERDETPIAGRTNILDMDVQQRVSVGARQDVVWGLGYRWTRDRLEGSFATSTDPAKRTYDQVSAFVQSTIDVTPERLALVLGSKLEHFDLGGVAFQPNARMLWTPDSRHTLWAAVSQAVRTPSRGDHDLRAARLAPAELVPEGFPTTFVEERGSRSFQPEEVTAYEMGVRGEARDGLFIDLALYYNRYDRLRTTEPRLPQLESLGAVSYVVVPFVVHNRMAATTRGLELSADWRPSPGLRLQPAWTWRQMDIELDANSAYQAGLGWEGVSPEQQLVLRGSVDLARDVELDLTGRFVGALPFVDVDSYYSLDARLAWRPRAEIEVVVAGHDLLAGQHTEFRMPHLPTQALDSRRGVRLQLQWLLGSTDM
jgi:iron complex outermembrane recepter protein